MDSIVNDIVVEIIDLITKVIPLMLVPCVLFPLLRFVIRSVFYYEDETLEVPENKEPEKPKESVVKTYVINSPVKMEPVSEIREVPKLCPYCLGVPDNDVRCSYCGIKF